MTWERFPPAVSRSLSGQQGAKAAVESVCLASLALCKEVQILRQLLFTLRCESSRGFLFQQKFPLRNPTGQMKGCKGVTVGVTAATEVRILKVDLCKLPKSLLPYHGT